MKSKAFVVLAGPTVDESALADVLPAGSWVRTDASAGLTSDHAAAAVRILRVPRAQEVRERAKIDPVARRFVRFPGTTIVSNVSVAGIDLMSGLPEVIKALPTLGPTFVLLPPSSYHVTLLDINCQYRMGLSDEEYEALLCQPEWPAAAERVAAANFSPKLVLRPGGLVVSSSVMILWLRPAGEDTPEEPRDWPLGVEVARDLDVPLQQHAWHLTLAYCIQPNKFLAAEKASVAAEIAHVEAAAIEACSRQGSVLDLEPARLCRFEDMTAFVPWKL